MNSTSWNVNKTPDIAVQAVITSPVRKTRRKKLTMTMTSLYLTLGNASAVRCRPSIAGEDFEEVSAEQAPR
jgi:hypothetical protein